MADSPSVADFVEIGIRAIIAVPGTRLTEEAVRNPGSTANILITSAALMAERVAQDVSEVESGLLIDTAEGSQLDRLAFDAPYNVVRRAASPAVLIARFTRPNAVLGAGSIPGATRFKLGGVSFRTQYSVNVGASAVTVDVTSQAEVTGPDGNVPSGTVGSMVDTLFDAFTPTAIVTGAGGHNDELDSELRERLRAAPRAARRGTLSAIEFGAKSVPGIAYAAAFEQANADGTLAHLVQLVVSDENGNSNAGLENRVALVMDEYRCAGIPVQLLSGEPYLQAIEILLTFLTGFDTDLAFARAQARIVAAVNSLAPGATLHLDLITDAARGDGEASTGIVSCSVVSPVGPVQPATSQQVIRTSTSLVTIAI